MVGLLPLAPHHDYLHYIHHVNGVKTGDIIDTSALSRKDRKMGNSALALLMVFDIIHSRDGKVTVLIPWIVLLNMTLFIIVLHLENIIIRKLLARR